MERTTIDLLQGTLGVLILKSLSWGPKHGYGIARWIEETAGDLPIEEGSLYPALHRMEQQGCLRSEWGVTERNREARFYSLTPRGGSQLAGGLGQTGADGMIRPIPAMSPALQCTPIATTSARRSKPPPVPSIRARIDPASPRYAICSVNSMRV